MDNDAFEKPQPTKSYKNMSFINSSSARPLRILAEFLEPQNRFDYYNVKHTIVFFGSARLKSKEDATKELKSIKDEIKRSGDADENLNQILAEKEAQLEMSKYYEDTVELARLVTKWAIEDRQFQKFYVCSGGGPGIMEAANKGAELAGGKSIGLNISLPFEQYPNKYISDELNLEFHYFFMRKFWFAYLAKALIIFPGGYGTLDELMEILTLQQTGKIHKPITIIVYGEDFWKKIVNFDELVRTGVISKEDLDLFKFVNTPEEAFNYLKEEMSKIFID